METSTHKTKTSQNEAFNINSSVNDSGLRCGFCTEPRTFGTKMGLSQHLRQAHPVDYNKLQEDRDSEWRSGARVVRRWTESELQLMVAMDVMAEREGRKRVRCYIATFLGRPLDSVSGKRRESTYKVLVDRLRAVHSDELSALIQRELKCYSSRRDTPTLSEPDPVSGSAGPTNIAPTTGDEGNGLGAPNREVTPTAQADGRRPWSDAELDVITRAKPTTKTKDLMKLLPGHTAIAIRSKRLRLKSAVSAPPLPPQSRVVTSSPADRPGKNTLPMWHPGARIPTGKATPILPEYWPLTRSRDPVAPPPLQMILLYTRQ